MRIHCAGSVHFVGGVPTILWQTGEVNQLIDNGVGNTTIELLPEYGIETENSVWLLTKRAELAGGSMVANSITSVNATQKTVISLVEQANPNPSVAVDSPFDFVCVDFEHGQDNDASLLGVALITYDQAVPEIEWQSGIIDEVAAVGAGIVDITLLSAYSCDALETVCILLPKSTPEAGQGKCMSMEPQSDLVWRTWALEEQKPAVSTLTDVAFTVMFISRSGPRPARVGYPRTQSVRLYNAGNGCGVAPGVINYQTGQWASIQRDAAGTYQTNYQAANAIGAQLSCMFAQTTGAMAAGAQRFVAQEDGTNPVTQRLFWSTTEQAGLASVLTDDTLDIVGVQFFTPP